MANQENEIQTRDWPDAHIHFFADFAEYFACSKPASPFFSSSPAPLFLNAATEEDWQLLQKVAVAERVKPFFGIHPWSIKDLRNGWEERLAGILKSIPHSGIGEIGLDWSKPSIQGPELRQRQREVFSRQLALAAEFNRPVSIHCVRAWDAIWELTQNFPAKKNLAIIFHAFSGSPEMVSEILLKKRWNAFFSLAVFQARPESDKWRRLLRSIPTERLLLESDAETAKEAASLENLYQTAAEILKISRDELKDSVLRNLNVVWESLASS
ncbi:MAG: hypothetical protein E7028_09675 [Planctomycetaceae bacterium]|nr:hypothetical protein [Planctomycetaceae bacterium]